MKSDSRTHPTYDLAGWPVRPKGLPNPYEQPVISAEDAFTLLGIDRGTGYKAIKDGTFPVPVIHVGRLIRVPTAALLRLLAIAGPDETSPERPPTAAGE